MQVSSSEDNQGQIQIAKQVHSDKVRARSQSTGQEQQAASTKHRDPDTPSLGRDQSPRTELKWAPGPMGGEVWAGESRWGCPQGHLSLPSCSHNYKNKPHQVSYQSVMGVKEISDVSETTLILWNSSFCTKNKHIQEDTANFSSACSMDKQVIATSTVINLNGS